MAVVQVLSQQLTNSSATPATFNVGLAGGGHFEEVANCVVGATDFAASLYRYCKIPSGARVIDVQVMNDANTSGTSYKCGVLLSQGAGGGVVVPASDQIFFSAVTMASARNVWTSLYFPSILGAAGLAANLEKRVYELLGLPTNPSNVYDVAISAVTPGTAGGNMALRLVYKP